MQRIEREYTFYSTCSKAFFFLLILFKNVALLLYDWRIIILLVILITQILSVHSCEKKISLIVNHDKLRLRPICRACARWTDKCVTLS